jgi:shikimate kinase
MPQTNRIYITGFMGSGKTTAGKKLASRLKWSFIDLDHELEVAAGKSINDLFSESGEESFRKLESETLRNLDIQKDTVISAGGGTPCFSDNMEFMNNTGIVIYLRMTPGQLRNRLSAEEGRRPLLKDITKNNLLQYIEEEVSEREKYYNRASIIINGINLNINTLIREIEKLMPNLSQNQTL